MGIILPLSLPSNQVSWYNEILGAFF